MPTLVTVVVIGAGAAIVVSIRSILNSKSDPVDPEEEEHWLISKIAHRPRLASFIRRRLDPSTASGLLLTIGFAAVLGLAALAGSTFDMITSQTGLAEWDEAFAEWGAANATETTSRIMRFVTELGGTAVVVAVAAIVGISERIRRGRWQSAAFLATVVAGQSLLNNGLKWIIERDRPAIAQLVGHAGTSFPSGHSAAAAATWAAVALVLGRDRPRSIRILLGAAAASIAAMVAATRVLLGVHWLTDVVAGVAVGWGWFIIAGVAFGGRIQWFGEPKLRLDREAASERSNA